MYITDSAPKTQHLDNSNSATTKGRVKWDYDSVKSEALKHDRRIDFKISCQSAYQKALKLGVLNEVCSHMPPVFRYWTFEEIKMLASKYSHHADFKRENPKAYQAARHHRWLKEVTSHYTKKRKWPYDRVGVEALFYTNRADFERGSRGAYSVAKHMGWLDSVCVHMMSLLRSDNDVIYIWKVISPAYLNLYKIGSTSHRMGDLRIKEVARKMGVEYEIIIFEKTQGKATTIEKRIFEMFPNVEPLHGFTGSTEFRRLTISQLETVRAMI